VVLAFLPWGGPGARSNHEPACSSRGTGAGPRGPRSTGKKKTQGPDRPGGAPGSGGQGGSNGTVCKGIHGQGRATGRRNLGFNRAGHTEGNPQPRGDIRAHLPRTEFGPNRLRLPPGGPLGPGGNKTSPPELSKPKKKRGGGTITRGRTTTRPRSDPSKTRLLSNPTNSRTGPEPAPGPPPVTVYSRVSGQQGGLLPGAKGPHPPPHRETRNLPSTLRPISLGSPDGPGHLLQGSSGTANRGHPHTKLSGFSKPGPRGRFVSSGQVWGVGGAEVAAKIFLLRCGGEEETPKTVRALCGGRNSARPGQKPIFPSGPGGFGRPLAGPPTPGNRGAGIYGDFPQTPSGDHPSMTSDFLLG